MFNPQNNYQVIYLEYWQCLQVPLFDLVKQEVPHFRHSQQDDQLEGVLHFHHSQGGNLWGLLSPLEDIFLKLQSNVRNNSSQHSLMCLHSNYVIYTHISLLNWLFPDISLTHSCLFPLVASPFQFFIKLINLIKKFNL